jgi:hypothetical protein
MASVIRASEMNLKRMLRCVETAMANKQLGDEKIKKQNLVPSLTPQNT